MALSRRSFLKRAAGAAGALAVAPLVTTTPAQVVPPVAVPVATPVPPPWTDTPLAHDAPYRVGRVDFDYEQEQERILREAALENAALIHALVRHSLISRDSAMAMMFKEG